MDTKTLGFYVFMCGIIYARVAYYTSLTPMRIVPAAKQKGPIELALSHTGLDKIIDPNLQVLSCPIWFIL